MQWLHDRFGVNFVYDSSLDLDVQYKGRPMAEISGDKKDELLKKCLEALFECTGIEWEINRKHVVLTKEGKRPRDYTIFIREQCDTLE